MCVRTITLSKMTRDAHSCENPQKNVDYMTRVKNNGLHLAQIPRKLHTNELRDSRHAKQFSCLYMLHQPCVQVQFF